MLSAIMICLVLLLCIQYSVHIVIAIIVALHAQGIKTINTVQVKGIAALHVHITCRVSTHLTRKYTKLHIITRVYHVL